MLHKCSAVAEMGHPLATIDMGQKVGVLCSFSGAAGVPIENNVAWAEVYLPTKWHLDPSSRLATTAMGLH